MSSPKAAAAKPARAKAAPRAAAKPKVVAESPAATNDASAEAIKLAGEITRALAKGQADVLSDEALQALMSAACKVYAAQIEGGNQILPLSERTMVSPTEVMVTASGLLRAANLAVFELGMWQSWTGR
jgi:predicted ABC-class ATPase